MHRTYAEAAFRPKPREPPVTTATLPFSEKSDGKSFRAVSSAMIAVLESSLLAFLIAIREMIKKGFERVASRWFD